MATTKGEKPLPAGRWYHRVFWLIAIWFASVLALGVFASGLRGRMHMAGMTSH
ncbi:DUF2474 domain-containing protein [Pseudomonas synxantha]|uniref:DUF2474 domain-containing protein n=1 Tax=Pseudomonas synxantha TaxID=47883 RepID=A0ABS0UD77_9PSED|nr:DUF2474 domain-containing protein [Pseudomonas synxantha]MBI6563535.1 DUF2474 domain-containing protein [Pseudomonas synxantha]MBI6581257.1 DUF2474 domain-containing protein [Pseudomonas synxantha]MBI6646986.1 DUF2474 domain-containing protein [Pseudomonas synxantha]